MSAIDSTITFIRQDILLDRLEVEFDSADDIPDDASLFDPDGIGLDSVEALEIIAALEGKYGISFRGTDEATIRERFHSVRSLAGFVVELVERKG